MVKLMHIIFRYILICLKILKTLINYLRSDKKNKPYIRLYDSKVAMMVSLYGNINEYLESVKVRK